MSSHVLLIHSFYHIWLEDGGVEALALPLLGELNLLRWCLEDLLPPIQSDLVVHGELAALTISDLDELLVEGSVVHLLILLELVTGKGGLLGLLSKRIPDPLEKVSNKL